MLIGQLLDAKPNATTIYFSPWFSRGGNLAKFTCQVFASESLSGAGDSFKISVQSKNTTQSDKDQDLVTPAGGTAQAMTLTALALTTWEVGANLSSASAGFLELVRFKYQLISANGGEPWLHFRILNPVWLSN